MCIDPAIAALETVNAVLEAANSALVKIEARKNIQVEGHPFKSIFSGRASYVAIAGLVSRQD